MQAQFPNDTKRRGRGAKVDATSPKAPSKRESSAELPPGVAFGKDNRRLGVGTKSEQPQGAEKGGRGNLTLTL